MSSREPLWYCYECETEIRPLMVPDPHCASCNGRFVEKIKGDADDPRSSKDSILRAATDAICNRVSSEELTGDRVRTSAIGHLALAPPPDKLHPTLSSWLKNINKLDGLINRLQDLASSAPTDHRSQLLNKVATLRVTFKKQQERCIEFLQLSEIMLIDICSTLTPRFDNRASF
ncbi:hypothetical protein BGY98DRAFT_366161 [Russula aff. rugulosa BPL654]|nr:hypothetical protein BGY98DRAFT_366161 [Russula aff. rugulosa BPL654]